MCLSVGCAIVCSGCVPANGVCPELCARRGAVCVVCPRVCWGECCVHRGMGCALLCLCHCVVCVGPSRIVCLLFVHLSLVVWQELCLLMCCICGHFVCPSPECCLLCVREWLVCLCSACGEECSVDSARVWSRERVCGVCACEIRVRV